MRETVTKRMERRAEKEANPPSPTIPNFLRSPSQGGKRSRDGNGGIKTPFVPGWVITEQDSVSGSSLLAVDWSKHVVTGPDMVESLLRSTIEESEHLGAQALYQVRASLNYYFVSNISTPFHFAHRYFSPC